MIIRKSASIKTGRSKPDCSPALFVCCGNCECEMRIKLSTTDKSGEYVYAGEKRCPTCKARNQIWLRIQIPENDKALFGCGVCGEKPIRSIRNDKFETLKRYCCARGHCNGSWTTGTWAEAKINWNNEQPN